MSAWQPISTAPKGEIEDDEREGAKVLLWLPKAGPWVARWREWLWLPSRPAGWYTTYSEAMSDDWSVKLSDRLEYAPTDWMPLPAPPSHNPTDVSETTPEHHK